MKSMLHKIKLWFIARFNKKAMMDYCKLHGRWSVFQRQEAVWGTQESVKDVARFYDKHKEQLHTLVKVLEMEGRNKASALLDHLYQCYIETENEKHKNKPKEQLEKAKEFMKKAGRARH